MNDALTGLIFAIISLVILALMSVLLVCNVRARQGLVWKGFGLTLEIKPCPRQDCPFKESPNEHN